MKTPREWAIEAFDGLKFLPSIEVVVAMLEEKFSTAQADARGDLLRVVEAVAKTDPEGRQHYCFFCEKEMLHLDEKHADNCAWVLARKLVGAAR